MKGLSVSLKNPFAFYLLSIKKMSSAQRWTLFKGGRRDVWIQPSGENKRIDLSRGGGLLLNPAVNFVLKTGLRKL